MKRLLTETMVTMLGVKFLLHDGATEVACRAERDLLRNRFGSTDRESDLVAFELYRDEIESAATRKYHGGVCEPHIDARVVVREEDLESALSRKLRGIP